MFEPRIPDPQSDKRNRQFPPGGPRTSNEQDTISPATAMPVALPFYKLVTHVSYWPSADLSPTLQRSGGQLIFSMSPNRQVLAKNGLCGPKRRK